MKLLVVVVAATLGSSPALVASRSAPPAPSSCSQRDPSAVTVVVDFGSLGGAVEIGCAIGLRSSASGADALAAAGIQWTPAGAGGFVCRIDGRPGADETVVAGGGHRFAESCEGTPPADAYWSYWQSDGAGTWQYADTGLTSSTVRPAGFEGWAFSTGDRTPPSVPPFSGSVAPLVVDPAARGSEPSWVAYAGVGAVLAVAAAAILVGRGRRRRRSSDE